MSTLDLFVSCGRGVEPLLADELRALGAGEVREARGGVRAAASLETGYRICLWSRLASRVLLPLAQCAFDDEGTAETGGAVRPPKDASRDATALYEAARGIRWPSLFTAHQRFAIEVAGRTPGIANTHFAGLRVKDAIVDGFRAENLPRPDVDTERPDIRVHLHLDRRAATISLDLAGDALHRRGYRARGVEAPLKENLAAALLVRAGWPTLMTDAETPLLDPMCGSATLLIEAAWMAADIAPGLLRRRWGFEAWLAHEPARYAALKREAEERRAAGLAALRPRFYGRDLDPRALAAARANLEHAGVAAQITLQAGDAVDARPPTVTPGLIITNPPYGERLAHDAELIKLYSLLGVTLKSHFAGWRFAFFTARDDLTPRLGLRAERIHSLYNGAIACKLLQFNIPAASNEQAAAESDDAFGNRLRKNLRHLSKWARRQNVSCYRLYDADLPEYAVAVDLYTAVDGAHHAQVQEYAAPKSVDPVRAEKRLRGALAQVRQVLELAPAQLHYKLRQSQKGAGQYQRQADTDHYLIVDEHGCKLRVNLDDYLDTGVFLDHRPLRRRIQAEAANKRFLNLFCYTGAASVHAAVGGAAATVSIDLSNTYLDWAQRNLLLNKQHSRLYERPPASHEPLPRHALIRADCLAWLDDETRLSRPAQFDLILLDPPTFSNSKKMEATLDVQRDQVMLIERTMRLLTADGVLYFSNNRRGFKLDGALNERYAIEDITAATLDEDFRRPPPPHRCWAVRHRRDDA